MIAFDSPGTFSNQGLHLPNNRHRVSAIANKITKQRELLSTLRPRMLQASVKRLDISVNV